MKLLIHANALYPEVSDPAGPWLRFLAQLAEEIGGDDEAVELSFTGDAGIRELNARWRGLDRATDVLSFSYGRSLPEWTPPQEDPVGEIVVSVERAREQAREYGHGAEEELSLLVIHGLFHIIGMDHEVPEEADIMAEAEEPYRRRLSDFFRQSG